MTANGKCAPGVVEWFRPGCHSHAEAALEQMRMIGVDRLRTHLSWAEFHVEGGRDWYDWLLPKLAAETDLLPCIHYTPPSIAENGRTNGPPTDLRAFADFIDSVIDRYGRHFEAVELWNEPNNLLDWDWRLDPDWGKFCMMAGAAANWVRQRGKRAVLGGLCPSDANLLRHMGERGLLQYIDVIGVHGFPGTWESEEGTWAGWGSLIAETREAVEPFTDNAEIWITEAGYSTWRRDEAEQARRFLEITAAPADRVYWYALQDLPIDVASQEGYHFDERHYHLGLFDSSGHPKLTARLLAHGGQVCIEQTLDLARPGPAIVGRKPVLVTGGAGFIGCNLADSLAADGRDVLVFDGLMRVGVEQNLAWLRRRHPARISATIGDVRDRIAVDDVTRDASGVIHLAAQVAVTSSLADPMDDFRSNLCGTLNLLEAIRPNPMPFVFASTNKVYGDLAEVPLVLLDRAYRPADDALNATGVGEDRSLSLVTPYGCSKGAADQYVLDYSRSFGLPTAVLRMSCVYGERQFGTEDQGWVAHFAINALAGRPVTIFGDGFQVRDILHVDDAVRAYRRVFDNIGAVSGRAFNLGGGPANAVSLAELVACLEHLIDGPVDTRTEPWRQGDQKYFVSDTRRLNAALGWVPAIEWKSGVRRLVNWLRVERADDVGPMPNCRAGSPIPPTFPSAR
ncbi:NAD-dependent epimerase/dehydratase family protein [Fodinicurvata sp. EGI_FJ10296]|uniref:NAD-dependent epimerase/dehydratase family protein n=1 Tax=Fodinicurvata sp. EGI_FJ10296 TaxID=3231908 RepID=UPI00345622D1